MKTKVISLTGDPKENLYQLGKSERNSFLRLEERVIHLLSTNKLLRHGQDIMVRARILVKKKEWTYFDDCLNAYVEGLGIELVRYQSFLSLFELAAHYGQVYPELKSLLPGCTSLFRKSEEGIAHSRLLDFPLLGLFEETTRLYYWKSEGKPTVLSMSCEGLAPLFFHAIHGSGFSMALHHKPGHIFHRDGQGIFQIAFDTLFECKQHADFKKVLKTKSSMTKWCFLSLDKEGAVHVIDLDGPASNSENYSLMQDKELIFTNIPIQNDEDGFEMYLRFSHERQAWLKEKLLRDKKKHPLDAMTDVADQTPKKWIHPTGTLSTVGAIHVNLSKGYVDIKEGEAALVASDQITRFSLGADQEVTIFKPHSTPSAFETSWKRASLAQAAFDTGKFDESYHHLQMAHAQMEHPLWKNIFRFYLILWDFKFVSNDRELAHLYKELKHLELPPLLKDHWIFLCMRFEKKLNLVPSARLEDVSVHLREAFLQEKTASTALWNTWMKLLYPRLEILDVFAPHQMKGN